jgi:Cdc6-like AAA superfamily ATPase
MVGRATGRGMLHACSDVLTRLRDHPFFAPSHTRHAHAPEDLSRIEPPSSAQLLLLSNPPQPYRISVSLTLQLPNVLITGTPGTGKSTTSERVAAVLEGCVHVYWVV